MNFYFRWIHSVCLCYQSLVLLFTNGCMCGGNGQVGVVQGWLSVPFEFAMWESCLQFVFFSTNLNEFIRFVCLARVSSQQLKQDLLSAVDCVFGQSWGYLSSRETGCDWRLATECGGVITNLMPVPVTLARHDGLVSVLCHNLHSLVPFKDMYICSN